MCDFFGGILFFVLWLYRIREVKSTNDTCVVPPRIMTPCVHPLSFGFQPPFASCPLILLSHPHQ